MSSARRWRADCRSLHTTYREYAGSSGMRSSWSIPTILRPLLQVSSVRAVRSTMRGCSELRGRDASHGTLSRGRTESFSSTFCPDTRVLEPMRAIGPDAGPFCIFESHHFGKKLAAAFGRGQLLFIRMVYPPSPRVGSDFASIRSTTISAWAFQCIDTRAAQYQ